MAKCSKSKNKLEDHATYKSSNLSEEHDSDLEAGENSPSTDNDTGYKEAKTSKRLTSKRRKLVISCTLSEHSRAAEVVVSNEDLLIEILILLPARSLLKFKSVCKHWRSLISDSKFASNHACRNPSSFLISGLYFYQRSWSTKELTSVSLHDHLSRPTLAFLDPVLEGSEYRVGDSCNGLLLFSNRDKMEYIVCNPSTQKYIALPKSGGSTSSVYYFKQFSAFLAFDPSKSPYYKVLWTREESAMGFRILEMKKDCCRWIVKCRVNLRTMDSVFPEGYGPNYGVLCCVKGANEEDFMLVLVIPGKVIAYNVNSKTVKVLLDLHVDTYLPSLRYCNAYQFIESLYPL